MISPQAKRYIAKGLVSQTNNWNGFVIGKNLFVFINKNYKYC